MLTARALEPDGWLHTGDKGSLRDGRITIRGRIKDIIVTSTGEKISPTDLEQAIVAGADLLKRLRAFRGRLPPDFKFDREEANAR